MEEHVFWRIVAGAMLALLGFPPGSDAIASQQMGAAISTTARGVRLTLTLPRRSYPKDALIRVKTTLQNITNHPVQIGPALAAELDRRGPGVEVVDSSGAVVYPPAVPWILAGGGKRIRPAPLRSGHALHRTMLVVLRADRIRATASVGPLGSASVITTPPIRVALTNEPSPTLVVSTEPALQLTVTPAVPLTEKAFYFIDGIRCPAVDPSGVPVEYGTGRAEWDRGSVLGDGKFHSIAACASPVRWVFAGGWLNHPAVFLDYPSH